jgi:hypothetical protein
VDPGRAASQAYRLPIHRNWYKPTISHNAVLVDAQPQQPAQGKLELFAANEDYAAAAASCLAAYPGTRYTRLLCMTPTYLVVFDRLVSDKPRRFDWVYHNRGTGVTCEAVSKPGKPSEPYVGLEYVENIKTGAADGPIRIQFPGKNVTTHLTLAAAPGTEVLVGDGVGASVLDRVPMVIITRRGAEARFAAVLEPVRNGQRPAVSEVTLGQEGETATITIRNGAATDTVMLAPENKLLLTSGGKAVLSSSP